MKKLLKKLYNQYMDATTKNCFWLITGSTYVPWMTGKE